MCIRDRITYIRIMYTEVFDINVFTKWKNKPWLLHGETFIVTFLILNTDILTHFIIKTITRMYKVYITRPVKFSGSLQMNFK